jgi:hypothetical protein
MSDEDQSGSCRPQHYRLDCGWFTGGGNQKFVTDTRWLFEQCSDLPIVLLSRPKARFAASNPAEALEILISEGSIQFALPYLRNALLQRAPGQNDRQTRPALERWRIAELSAAGSEPARGDGFPVSSVSQSFLWNGRPAYSTYLMEGSKFRDAFADVVLFAMAVTGN